MDGPHRLDLQPVAMVLLNKDTVQLPRDSPHYCGFVLLAMAIVLGRQCSPTLLGWPGTHREDEMGCLRHIQYTADCARHEAPPPQSLPCSNRVPPPSHQPADLVINRDNRSHAPRSQREVPLILERSFPFRPRGPVMWPWRSCRLCSLG